MDEGRKGIIIKTQENVNEMKFVLNQEVKELVLNELNDGERNSNVKFTAEMISSLRRYS